MSSHQSTGLHPRRAAWVDTATILPAVTSHATTASLGTGLRVSLNHNEDVSFVAYFSATATGSVKIQTSVDDSTYTTLAVLTAPSGGGRVLITRDGVELPAGTIYARVASSDFAGSPASTLTAGAVQVSLFSGS